MSTDKFFTIGKTHNVCQDYALSGEHNGISYAIVSDGCSSSPDTDFGARFLAKSCEQQILRGHNFNGERIIYEASGIARQIGLPETCLDATLICAIKDNNDAIKIYMHGDGVILGKYCDGSIHYDNTIFIIFCIKLPFEYSIIYIGEVRSHSHKQPRKSQVPSKDVPNRSLTSEHNTSHTCHSGSVSPAPKFISSFITGLMTSVAASIIASYIEAPLSHTKFSVRLVASTIAASIFLAASFVPGI